MFSSSSPKSLRFSAQLVAKTVNGRSLTKLLPRIFLLVSLQFVLGVLAHAQITLSGRVMYSTGEPAAGASVNLTKSVYEVSPPIVTTDSTTADGAGNYSFQVEGRCAFAYEVTPTTPQTVTHYPSPRSHKTQTTR